jgi:hypothetical protein
LVWVKSAAAVYIAVGELAISRSTVAASTFQTQFVFKFQSWFVRAEEIGEDMIACDVALKKIVACDA